MEGIYARNMCKEYMKEKAKINSVSQAKQEVHVCVTPVPGREECGCALSGQCTLFTRPGAGQIFSGSQEVSKIENVNSCFKKHWNIHKLQQECGEQLPLFSLAPC